MALALGTRLAIGIALSGALGYLVLSDSGEGVLEYLYVEQVMADQERYEGRTIKMHGTVVAGSVTRKVDLEGDYRFVVEHAGMRVPVHYTSLLPDTFQEGGEVVLTGRLDPASGVFESAEMSAKCPSKYEEQDKVSMPTPES